MSNTEVPNKQPGFVRYIMAANATGGGSVFIFLIAAVIFYPLGYYTKYNDIKSKGAEIVTQALNNKELDTVADKSQDKSKDRLHDSLAYLGYSDKDIDYLTTGKASGLDGLKKKFTKYVKGKTIYLPRNDCGNDYLGVESANEANQIIMNGFMNRYKAND